MKWNHDSRGGIVTVLSALLILAASGAVLAGNQPEEPTRGPTMMDESRVMGEDMMQMRKQMHARMQAMDERLDTLVTAMHEAGDDDKADAVAAVVTELVNQRKAMHSMMMEMQPQMMRHMMQHMSTGMTKGVQQSMSDCPMMQRPSAAGAGQEVEEPPAHHPGE